MTFIREMTSIVRKISAPITIKKVKPACQVGTARSYDDKQERPSFQRSLSERLPERTKITPSK